MLRRGVITTANIPNPDLATMIPISDIPKDANIDCDERIYRNKLACLYRILDMLKWSQSIYNHATVRLSPDTEEILINPFGLFYNEITASSLIKVNLAGDVISNGSTDFGINQAGYILHSAIHTGRPEVCCVIHLHHPSVVAVSAMKCGFLPLSQEAMIIGEVAYHDYRGILVDAEERISLVEDLGDKNVMILRNHGVVICGQSIEHALHLIYHFIIACETQVKCVPNGITDNLVLPNKEAVDQVYEIASLGAGGVNRKNGEVDANQWKIGELEWQAYMRSLDRLGLKTNHQYR